MKYILRIKAVSQCVGIRRAQLGYAELKNQNIDLLKTAHPLKNFKNILVDGMNVTVDGVTHRLIEGSEIYFYQEKNVDTGNGTALQQITMGILLLPIAPEMEEFYVKQINDGYTFDQWNGEFEYLIGLMYDLCLNSEKCNEWYDKAKNKRFTFGRIDNIN